jgi:hypothetical protein
MMRDFRDDRGGYSLARKPTISSFVKPQTSFLAVKKDSDLQHDAHGYRDIYGMEWSADIGTYNGYTYRESDAQYLLSCFPAFSQIWGDLDYQILSFSFLKEGCVIHYVQTEEQRILGCTLDGQGTSGLPKPQYGRSWQMEYRVDPQTLAVEPGFKR